MKSNLHRCLVCVLGIIIAFGMTGSTALSESTAASLQYESAEAPIIDTSAEYALLQDIVRQIRERTDFVPRAALVLGSGLNDLAERMDQVAVIPYSELRGMPVSTAPGHAGRFVFGYLSGVPVVVMQGRVHCYEGYSALQAVRPIRVMKLLGADTLVLTNSSGAINTDFRGGEIMMITDQILFGVQNPLTGANNPELGERFTDMKDAYDIGLRQLLRDAADETGVHLAEGTYLQDAGPSYETVAEVRMLRILGADAAGMSTGIEAVAAMQMGMRICGLSCVTVPAADVSATELNDEVVNALADA